MGSSSSDPITTTEINNLLLKNKSFQALQNTVNNLSQEVQDNTEKFTTEALTQSISDILTNNTDVKGIINRDITSTMLTVDLLNTEYGISLDSSDNRQLNINKSLVNFTGSIQAKVCTCNSN